MKQLLQRLDWVLILALLPILGASLVTLSSFSLDNGDALRQVVWIVISFVVMLIVARGDMRALNSSRVITILYFLGLFLLISVLVIGTTVKGAQSWIDFGAFSFQPADVMKVILILVLAKYFSRRHIEIAHYKHILISGLYMIIPFFLVFLQPDFGSAMVLFMIWFGMILMSGVSKKHLLILGIFGISTFLVMWFFVFQPYQRNRILSFIHPLSDIQGAGYNAYQSAVAVGSGQVWGKGLGYGTQSRLNFLPEYQTDFIFAAFAEEWGFVGSSMLLLFFSIVIWRIIRISLHGASNFEMLFGVGVVVYFMTHIIINIGMNLTLLPVTGLPLPFMSKGGSHLLAEFLSIGTLMSFRGYGRVTHRDNLQNEIVGVGDREASSL